VDDSRRVAAGLVCLLTFVVLAASGCGSSVTYEVAAPVTAVSLPATASVNVNATTTLTATVLPANASKPALKWQSTDPATAAVSSSGVVTGVKTGTVQIVAKAMDGSNVSSNICTVTVNSSAAMVTSITLSSTASVNVGATTTLTPTVLPANATNPTLTWQSSNTAIATVSASGVVTGVAAGTAQITAASTDGSNITSNICTVTVVAVQAANILVTSITIPSTATVSVGLTTPLTATVLPANATNPALAWQSSNPTIVSVSSSGAITGVQAGTANIAASSTDGSNISSNICTVTVTATATGTANAMGINLGPTMDYATTRMFADAMKTSRAWSALGSWGPPIGALDANGWPTQDASITVWQGIGNMQGTYTLSFTGQAIVTGSFFADPIPTVYNPSTNQSTATIPYNLTDGSGLLLTFTDTQRTATSGVGTGITNVSLMRPQTVGGTTPYPATQVFTTPFLNALAPFSVLRTMDYSATNGNTSVNWADRTLPSDASQVLGHPAAPVSNSWEGRGGSWEYAILLANQTNKDLWINVPEQATDDYVTKLAQLIQYGSDGTNAYTSVQTSPVWPPLAQGLHVYVEFSNEVWNTGFQQAQDNHTQAAAEVTAGNSPLNFDGSTNDWYWAWRRTAERTVEIGNDFRQVVGDANMMTRVRPVLMSQLGYTDGPLLQEMLLMIDYYDNPVEVSTPEPPSYYVYGLGGSAYYSPTDLTSVDTIFSTMGDSSGNGSNFVGELQSDADFALAFGVHRVAYEGGPSLPSTGDIPLDANQAAAWADPRMEGVVVSEQNAWSQNAGDLLLYYELAESVDSAYEWSFVQDVLTPTSPKMSAIAALNAAPRSVSTYGTPLPATLTPSNANIPPQWAASQSLSTMSNQNWAGFSVEVSTAGAFQVVLNTGAATTGAQIEVFADGNSIGTVTVTNTGSLSTYADNTALTTPQLSVGSHGILVRSVAGVAQLNQVKVQAAQ